MRRPLKSIVTSLGSLLIILISTTQTSESCVWGPEGEDYRVAFFTSKVLGDKTFEPFYYTPKAINEYVPDFESDKMRNLKLWQEELGSSVELSDIDELLYGAKTEDVLSVFNEGKEKEVYGENTFLKALLNPDNEAIFEYFAIAKYNEYVNFIGYSGDGNPWNFEEEEAVEETAFEVPSRAEIMEAIDESWAAANSDFLKQRYAYLQLVNYRYTNEGDKGMALFKKDFDKKNNDIITAWAIFHAAACTKNKVESNYLLSVAFDKCDSKKVRSYFGFDKDLLEETVAFTNISSEKATIYAMSGMNNPGRKMDLIKKVHSIDAKNPNLRGLIYREISKIEDWLLTSKVTGMEKSVVFQDENFYGYNEYEYDYKSNKRTIIKEHEPQLYRNEVNWSIDYFNLKNYNSDLEYTREFREFLIVLLNQTTETTQQDFLKLAISHLFFIDDKPNEALKYNGLVSNNNAQTKTQQQVNNILLLSLTNDILSENTKTEFAKSFAYLENHLMDFNKPLRTISQLNLYLSKLYFKKGDLITAAFLHQKSNFTGKQEWEGSDYYKSISFFDRYATIAQIEDAIVFLNKKNPTAFEKYLLNNYSTAFAEYIGENKWGVYNGWGYEENQNARKMMQSALIDLQGTVAFRQDDLKMALLYFKKLPADYWEANYYFSEYLTQNPFTKKDIWNNAKSESMKTNKIDIVEKLLALKQKAESENDANAYFELGNAYYNFTYHGNSWMMFSYGNFMDEIGENSKVGYWHYSFYPNTEKYFDVYYGCERAEKIFQKAVNAAKMDVELEARAAIMVGFCQKIRTNKNNDYLKDWAKKYSATNTFRNSNCSVLQNIRKKGF
jgi:hypothetical protein